MPPPNQFVVDRNKAAAFASLKARSPNVWRNFPWDAIRNGEVLGTTYYNDYDAVPLAPTLTTQIAFMEGKGFATSSCTIAPVKQVNSVDLGGGILQFLVASSANSASWAHAYESYKLPGNKTSGVGKICCEARIAVAANGILTNRIGFMFGLAETSLWTLATGVPYSSNAGAITNSAAFIGFEKLPVDTTQLHTAYSDRATSFTEVGTNQAALVANTFTNIAFTYDPFDPDTSRRIRFYQDNLELGTAISQTTLAAFSNLNANSLGLILAAVGGSAVSSDVLYVDAVRVGQVGIAA